MTKLEKIEQDVAALTNEEIRQFADWFIEFQEELWDRQIARDAAEGRLDKLAEAAVAHHRAGRTTRL